ncbi:cytoplasmic heat shock protein 70 [Histomonas meleagridis]|uniref:cytoplasmic heat shock protein 70 n=1 Tax=Histomonas meleagridis TaxID=135588 RepID=UPI003559FE7E|nr:cytoplasmic heat shock protein 70 [Histomonas meleagridis]KAH0796707.1 cytoplasmic heat shock protein 70 [Histomonas meleagridis]
MIAVGMDLGTTYSCVSICRNGNIEVFTDSLNNRTIPSFVTFTNNDRLVGQEAKEAEVYNMGNAVFDVKRLIGRKFSDDLVQQDIKNLPFKVIQGEDDRPLIEVTWMNEVKHFYPEQISGMVLEHLKRIAEEHLRKEVKDVVITVPAYFNDSQRTSTIIAAQSAGLNVLHVINEPTAAAIAYGHKQQLTGTHHILTYDLGGGTFDVSIVRIQNNEYKVIAKGGNTHLGGRDFDNIMFEHLAKEFYKIHNCDLTKSQRSCCLLRNLCEKAKKDLSVSFNTRIHCPTIYDGKDFTYNISRAEFNDLIIEKLNETLQTVKDVIHESNLQKSDIDDIVLVGGSSKIPIVKDLLTTFFGKPPKRLIDPDEAVVVGAAIEAESIENDEDDGIVLLDVTSLSLGLEVLHGKTEVMIPRNTLIPHTITRTFYTTYDNQPYAIINVLEGERVNALDNNQLGEFQITDLTPAIAGKTQILVTFNITANGTLTVTAQEKSTDNIVRQAIVNVKGRLTDEQIQRILEDAERYRQQDLIIRQNYEAMNSFQLYINHVLRIMKRKYQNQNQNQNIKNVIESIQNIKVWSEDNNGISADTIKEKRKELERLVAPFIEQ